MIKTFADKHTQEIYICREVKKASTGYHPGARRKLEYVDIASRLEDLRTPPGNKLHRLVHDREGQHAICINDQWRVCFRFTDGDAYEVEVTDCH